MYNKSHYVKSFNHYNCDTEQKEHNLSRYLLFTINTHTSYYSRVPSNDFVYLVLFSLKERDRRTTTIHNVKRHCKLKGKQKINADRAFTCSTHFHRQGRRCSVKIQRNMINSSTSGLRKHIY